MISAFRRMLDGPGKWVVVALLVLAFAFFGVPSLDNFRATEALSVGDRAYTAREVDQAFARNLSRAQSEAQAQGQRPPSRPEAIERGMLEQTLQELTGRALIAEEAQRLGLVATDEMVQRAVRQSGAFDDPATGEFSPRLLALALEQSRISPAAFREDVRGEIVRNQLVGALAGTARAPEQLTDFLLLRQNEERELRTAIVSAAAPTEPDDAALRSYYAANANRYLNPEFRTYRALIIDDEAVAERVEVTDEDVAALFAAREGQLGTPATRTFRQARFPDMSVAEAAAARVRAGEPLVAVARELDAASTRLADRTEADIVDEAVRAAVFGEDAPGIVGPIEGVFGATVIEVEALTPGTTPSLAEIEPELRDELREEDTRRALIDAIEEVEIAFDEGATLADAAEAAGLLAPRAYGPVDADLFTAEGAVSDAPGAVHRAAFTLGEGDLSDVVELDDGGYAFVAMDQVVPESTRPFEEVTDRVRRDLAAEERKGALRTAIAAFRSTVEGGQSFDEAATAIGSDVQTKTIAVSRPDPDLPPAFLREVFNADIGTVVAEETPQGDQAILAIVDGVRFGTDPRGGALKGAARDQLGQTIATELVNAYLESLSNELGVERDEAVIAQQFGEG